MTKKPQVHRVKTLAKTRLFHIEGVELEFSNGARREFERINNSNAGAVMVIPLSQESIVLVREYAVGAEEYELGFVKGLIDPGESPEQAADREMKEEIGFGARSIQLIRKLRLTPHYTTAVGYTLLAEQLYPERREGDEPEPLEVVHWPREEIDALLSHDEINDVRTLHALYWLREYLARESSH